MRAVKNFLSVVVGLSVVMLIVFCANMKSDSLDYVSKIYEKDGKSYLDVSFKTTDTILRDNDPVSIAEFAALKETDELITPKKGVSNSFYKDFPDILEYRQLQDEYVVIKNLKGKDKTETSVLEEIKDQKGSALARAKDKYKVAVSKVPYDLTLNLTTIPYTRYDELQQSTWELCWFIFVVATFLLAIVNTVFDPKVKQ